MKPPPPPRPDPRKGVWLEDIMERLPQADRDAMRTRTAEVLLGMALKQKLSERKTGKS